MFASSRRHQHLDIWPGFVDAMATLLMVIVFVLMTFVVAQLYLTDALNGSENALHSLEGQMAELEKNLSVEKMSRQELENQASRLQSTLQLLHEQVNHLKSALQNTEKSLIDETEQKQKAQASITSLTTELETVNAHLNRLSKALDVAEDLNKEQSEKIEDLQNQFKQALLDKVEELKALNEKLLAAQSESELMSKELKKLKDPKRIGLKQFRSEFFAKLTKILGERKDIRIVGDRFVFQSEVLFDKGSAEIKQQGLAQLKSLASTLKEISAKIPKEIYWILRIDGHTDRLPIKGAFASNWELSSARAIAVVKFLIAEGIAPQNLVAAGFGEHQPLSAGNTEDDFARNRRIEFKLDQR